MRDQVSNPPKPAKSWFEKSQDLQRKLYLAAKKDRKRKFHALYDRIYRTDILYRAWKEVSQNGGSAGIDGVTIDDIREKGVQEFLDELQVELRDKTYRPKPVLRVNIPKADGRTRPLGIPTVKDRVVQYACKIVIEPLFEANFQNFSYGFRPKRSAADAVKAVRDALICGWWVIDADIQGYFDNIDHEVLMSLVRRRIFDGKVLKLLKSWLKAGFVEDGTYHRSDIGSPQGGVISPLLANIYLHILDMYWTENCSHLGKLIRYADDFVVVCRTPKEAHEAFRVIKSVMKFLKLTLHPEKTKLVRMDSEGFDFLGFHFRKLKSRRRGKLLPYRWPCRKAMNSIRCQIREETSRKNLRSPPEVIIKKLNPIIRGWRNYFLIGNSSSKFCHLDSYLRQCLWRLERARKGSRGRLELSDFQRWMKNNGLERFYIPGICLPKPKQLRLPFPREWYSWRYWLG